MIVNAGYRGKVGAAAPKFTYTGKYNIRKDGVVELLTSGTIVFLEPKVIDVFMVGGGGRGSDVYYTSLERGAGGGGGGYTRTVKNYAANGTYPIVIGGGSSTAGVAGASTSFGTALSVDGGESIKTTDAPSTYRGGNGGSGGGGGVKSNSDYGAGGSDGANGETGYPTTIASGAGQGYSTREFGEPTGKLYAGGGGGGRYISASTAVVSPGGAGGGGTGGWFYNPKNNQAPAAGVANTGGGGGGGARGISSSGTGTHVLGASGGSGIVCFREAQVLPELTGTWVLNNRLYRPESTITQALSYTIGDATTVYDSILIDKEYVRVRASGQSGYSVLYTFSNSEWGGRSTIKITSTTASDEFRSWLASNATKQ